MLCGRVPTAWRMVMPMVGDVELVDATHRRGRQGSCGARMGRRMLAAFSIRDAHAEYTLGLLHFLSCLAVLVDWTHVLRVHSFS